MIKKSFKQLSMILSTAMLVTSMSGPVAAYGSPILETEDAQAVADVMEDTEESVNGVDEYLDKGGSQFYFAINSDGLTATITRYDKPEYVVEGTDYGDLEIPEVVKDEDNNEYTVTAIGDGACEDLIIYEKNLIIPETVTYIGMNAFAGCYKLTGDLVIPDSVITIGTGAFWQCEGFDGNLILGNNVTDIGEKAFCNCKNLKGDLIIPDSVEHIENEAFYGDQGFEGKLVLGSGLETIGKNAFTALGGLNVTGDVTISDNVISIGESAFANDAKLNGRLILGKNLQSIGMMAFSGCKKLNGTLTIPDSVTTIGEHAFNLCTGFTGTLTIGTGLKDSPTELFYACTGIKRVVNNSENEIDLKCMKDILQVTWADESTGDTITSIKLGTAVRSDYTPEDEPVQPEDEAPATVSGNVPTDYHKESRTFGDDKFEIYYCHKTPFFGKSKPGIENFSTEKDIFIVVYDKKAYKVSKIKVNKKKLTIQIAGLEDADRSIVKAIKKATKSADGLPFTIKPYIVSNKDDVVPKLKKDGSLTSAKIDIFGKYYKAKKDEFDYNDKTGVIKFKGNNLTGSYTIKFE